MQSNSTILSRPLKDFNGCQVNYGNWYEQCQLNLQDLPAIETSHSKNLKRNRCTRIILSIHIPIYATVLLHSLKISQHVTI